MRIKIISPWTIRFIKSEHIWSVTDSLKMKRCVQFGKITVLYCTVFTVHSIIAFTVMELWTGSVSYNSE